MPKNFQCLKVSVVVDNHTINEVHHTKFLGVIIDNKLKWKEHIGYIRKKMAKGIGVIVKARKVFDKVTLLSIYDSLILPYIYLLYTYLGECIPNTSTKTTCFKEQGY